MPVNIKLHYTDLLKKQNWTSRPELMKCLEEASAAKFTSLGLLPKETFIENVKKQLAEVDDWGKMLADMRETLGEEYIDDYHRNDYAHLMQGYKKERKKLRELLLIMEVFRK